ncbi:MAG: EamA family transporter [Bacteroidota bacterium]|nr:EamA family transporter [Bacteroidota bacterium]
MGFLFFSILSATCIFIIFRYFEKFEINNVNAIFINYLTAFIFGISISGPDIFELPTSKSTWIILALIIGILFVLVFFIMAKSTQIAGITVSSIATKMSVIIPMTFSIVYYHEQLYLVKILAIAMAPIGVFLVVVKRNKRKETLNKFSLPILLFLGAGLIDSLLKYVQASHLQNGNVLVFSTYLFFIAMLTSYLSRLFLKNGNRNKISKKDIIGGLILGLVNFGSLSFIILALRESGLDSSLLFGINNIGIILLSIISGIILFKEKLSPINWIGIFVSIVTLFLLFNAG